MALLCHTPQSRAAGRADEILGKLAAGFRSMGAYGVTFEVVSSDNSVRGNYAVKGEHYHILLGDAEVYCDGKARYEVDNRRREVTVDKVDASSRNVLDNPARAFDFVGSEYTATLESEKGGEAILRLTPASKHASTVGAVILTVDTTTMRPRSLVYDYDGEQVRISVLGISPLDAPLKAFAKTAYDGYEFIDFR